MSVFSRLKSALFGSPVSEPQPPAAPANDLFRRGNPDELVLRRWEAAETTRTNRAQWRLARDESINQALLRDLATLRIRCAHEITTNPVIAGMVETHATSVVGPDGPALQVFPAEQLLEDSDVEAFDQWARAAEDVLDEWSEDPSFNGDLSLAEMLRLWVRQLWGSGEFMAQKLTARDFSSEMPFTLRLHTIEPERVPVDSGFLLGGGRGLLGMQLDDYGKVVRYYVGPYRDFETLKANDYEPVPADMLLHGYQRLEAGQLRGVPWLASALPAIADMRQYDRYVMEAAKVAASHAMVYYADNEKITPEVITGPMDDELRPGRMFKLPNGYKGMQIDGKHPGPQYVEYRIERQGEYGAAAQLPGSVVRQDSSRHNYSSARIDRQAFQRGNACVQNLMERPLQPCFREVLREAEMSKALPPRPRSKRRNKPIRVRVVCQWEQLPHVDPLKERKATSESLRTGEIALVDVWAAQRKRPAQMVTALRRSIKALEAAGFTVQPAAGEAAAERDEEETDAQVPA